MTGAGGMDANLGVPARHVDILLNSTVVPRLDLGIFRRKLTRGLQPEVWMSSPHLLKGDTKIKSWYDGKAEEIA
jgi:hypothetical protein